MLAFIAILMIAACFLLVLSKKVHMIVPFIVIPIVFAVIAGFPLKDISKFIVDGVSSTNNAVLLILFSVAYFSLLSETGMFDIVVNRITKLTKNNIYVVLLCTVAIAMIGHMDGAYNTTYLITIPTLLPLYKKLRIDSRILMFLTVMGATVMCVTPWSALVVQLTPFAEVEAAVLSQRPVPYAGIAFVLAIICAVLFGISTVKKNTNVELETTPAENAELDFSNKPYSRPQLFWVNFFIFITSILCLFLVKVQTYILFMLFTCITLVINYRDVKDQGQLIRKYSGYKGQLLGTAFTVRVPQGDNLMFHAAMDLAKPGDVIVIDAGGFENRAIFGELMATYCKSRGIKGIVCDGAVRDKGGLAAMENFHVYARSATPNGPYKNGPGEINVPVVIGGKIVHPGDIVVGDDDGVLFIDPAVAEDLARATHSVEMKEAAIMDHILNDGTYVRPWVDQKLTEIGCEIL